MRKFLLVIFLCFFFPNAYLSIEPATENEMQLPIERDIPETEDEVFLFNAESADDRLGFKPDNLLKRVATFLCAVKTKCSINSSSINCLISNVSLLFSDVINMLKTKTQSVLAALNVDRD